MKERTRTLSVLLTQNTDTISKLFNVITAGVYTHASIGIEEWENEFFSFVTKGGFRIERPIVNRKAKREHILCALYRLDVPYEVYEDIKHRLQAFSDQKNQYHFSFWGAFLCLMRIPHRFNNRYFCSQFVSELITSTGAAHLSKQPSLYLPDDFKFEPQFRLCFQGTLAGLAEFL
jgi:hypothetical protein